MTTGRHPGRGRRTRRHRAGLAGCAMVREALGVYVTGAISPADRALVNRHLAVCRDCRDELAGLAGLPGLLGRLTLEQAERAAGHAPGSGSSR